MRSAKIKIEIDISFDHRLHEETAAARVMDRIEAMLINDKHELAVDDGVLTAEVTTCTVELKP